MIERAISQGITQWLNLLTISWAKICSLISKTIPPRWKNMALTKVIKLVYLLKMRGIPTKEVELSKGNKYVLHRVHILGRATFRNLMFQQTSWILPPRTKIRIKFIQIMNAIGVKFTQLEVFVILVRLVEISTTAKIVILAKNINIQWNPLINRKLNLSSRLLRYSQAYVSQPAQRNDILRLLWCI